jgi:hypothetical protein
VNVTLFFHPLAAYTSWLTRKTGFSSNEGVIQVPTVPHGFTSQMKRAYHQFGIE